MPNRKNVLFLTIEALRFDRTGIGGYERPTTPNIDKLSKNSIYCTNAFALAPCTQPSFPTIMTSTRPLSFGGYDLGALNRPTTVTDHLKNNGYFTEHLVTFPWLTSTYGYGKKLDRVSYFFSLSLIVKATIFTIRSSIKSYMGGRLSKEQMLRATTPRILNCFSDVEKFALDLQMNDDYSRHFKGSKFAQERLNLAKILQVTQTHRKDFMAEPAGYILQNLTNLPLNSVAPWLLDEIYQKSKFAELRDLYLTSKVGRAIKKYVKKNHQFLPSKKLYVDGTELADQVIEALARAKKQSSPIFLWTHFLDTHTPYQAGQPPNWQKNMSKILMKLGATHDLKTSSLSKQKPETEEEKLTWSDAYDCCVNYIDTQIGRIIGALKELDLYDDTIIVIAGDHGEEIGEHSEYGHRFRFYDECLRVPIIFHSPQLEEHRVDALVDLRDLAPTLSTLAGVAPNPAWQGDDLTKKFKEKKHLIFECFHRGNCLFLDKPLYIGVRTKTHKFIWREWIDTEDLSATAQIELYDLENDPEEEKNIYERSDKLGKELEEIVFERLMEIPEYVEARGLQD